MDMVRKGFGNKPLKDFYNGEEESGGIWRVSWEKIVDESILFSLVFLSQNSLWKFFLNRGYKGIYIVGWEEMWKVKFFPTGCFDDLTSQLGWVASSSREQMTKIH